MNRIKLLRSKKKLTQIELARMLGVAQNTLSTWENGRYEPDIASTIKLADFFGVSIDYLMGRDEQSKNGAKHLAEKLALNDGGKGIEETRIYNELMNNERYRNFASGMLDLDEEDLEALEDYGRYLKERKKGQK